MSPEKEPLENCVRKIVLTLHEADNHLNFELFVGTEFPIVENARVFVGCDKITGEEFFKSLKTLTYACQKLIEKEKRRQQEKS